MINSSATISSATSQEKDSSLQAKVTPKKTKQSKKAKKKGYKCTSKQQLNITRYADLHSRRITKIKDIDRSISAFKTRINTYSPALKGEMRVQCNFVGVFPSKRAYQNIPHELDIVYNNLGYTYIKIKEGLLKSSEFEVNYEEIKEIITELIEAKQKIITIWNQYNPTATYKYGYNPIDDDSLKLEDCLLDFIQSHLFNCYSLIDDYKNKQLILDQLMEQKSKSCYGLLTSSYINSLSDPDNLEDLNFTTIPTNLIVANELSNKTNSSAENKCNSNNPLVIFTSLIKMFSQKHKSLDYCQLDPKSNLYQSFMGIIGYFTNYYQYDDEYIKSIHQLSLAIDFYYSKLEHPLFKGIHDTLLSENKVVFLGEFSALLKKLSQVTTASKESMINTSQNSKQKSIVLKNLHAYNRALNSELADTKQQIIDLLVIYNIPTDDINSWYDIFITDVFLEIFLLSTNVAVILVEWLDLSIKTHIVKKTDTTQQDALNTWLNILENDQTSLVNDHIEWVGIPQIILDILLDDMIGDSLKFAIGTSGIVKKEDIAIINAKIGQIYRPFLGTVFLAIVNKDNYDELLTVLDMLEVIFQDPKHKSPYIQKSKYLAAQIITYLIDNNKELDLEKKQLLFNKAESLYLELADSGVNEAYLFLIETTASLAKIKMHDHDFLEAARLYDKASMYGKILSEIDGIDAELQDLSIININCFSAEAEILRKIYEEQNLFLQEPTSPPPKISAKNKKKSRKKLSDIATDSEPQELAKEVTIQEVIDWSQTYKTTDSQPKNKKITKVTQQKVTTKLPTRDELASKRDFWQITKTLQMSATNLEKSYLLLVQIIQSDYFNMLESQFKNGITSKDSWVVLLVYQNIAYYHFLQQKDVKEIGYNNMKLFYGTNSKIQGASKAEKVTLKNVSSESEQFIRQVIKLVCPDIPNVETKNIMDLILSLSPANYNKSPYKNRLAAAVSTYGHLISLDDIAQGRRSYERLAAKLYDKADEINPNRVIKKLAKKVA